MSTKEGNYRRKRRPRVRQAIAKLLGAVDQSIEAAAEAKRACDELAHLATKQEAGRCK